jgi:hypothetical protein
VKEFPATKDIKLSADQYRLSRMTPQAGSWIVMQLLTKALSSNMKGSISRQNLGTLLPEIFGQFSEDEFRSLQAKCFAATARLTVVGDQLVAQSMFMQDGTGRWAVKEPSLPEALALTIHSLVFNLEPFFDDGMLEMLLGSLPVLSPSSSPQ